jgi:Zn-dependent protease with chaperone function
MSNELSLAVTLFDGRRPVVRPASLRLAEGRAFVEHRHGLLEYPADELRVSPRVARAPRFVSLPDGRELCCADDPVLDALRAQEKSEGLVAWLEQREWIALVAVVVTVTLLFFAHRRGVPWLASVVAERMPPAYEAELGRHSLEQLDEHFLEPSTLEPSLKETLRGELTSLTALRPTQPRVRLEFRSSVAGANAFTLPGGTIIVTDELARSCTADEVAAVLAHELGHVERHHTVRQLLSGAGTGALVTAVLGDASTLAVAVGGVPAVLIDLEYSRDAESEADDEALRLLAASGRSPSLFADALDCIERTLPKGARATRSFLSTHPGSAERKARARSGLAK